MATLDFSESGGNAFDDLSPRAKLAVKDKAIQIKEDPGEELISDTAYLHHYAVIEVEDRTYIIVAKWDRVKSHVQIRNIGQPEQTRPP